MQTIKGCANEDLSVHVAEAAQDYNAEIFAMPKALSRRIEID
jgi:hypothetical protein